MSSKIFHSVLDSYYRVREKAIDRFERAWKTGPPDLRQFVSDSPELRDDKFLVQELVVIDLEYRWKQTESALATDPLGSRPWWPDYAAILPILGPVDRLPIFVICESYEVLRSLGHRIDPETFIALHPVEPLHVFSPDSMTLEEVPLPSLTERLRYFESVVLREQRAHPSTKNALPIEARADISAPLLFSDYLLEAMLGAGGTGKVYRALHKLTGKLFAIKTLLKKRQRDPQAVGQFVAEARIVERLRHPGIVATHGLGKYPAGGYFLAMDLVVGENLQTRLARASLLPPTALAIVRRVAEAIDYAHSQGVVHGDLKPSNVLLDEKMQPHVVDFGMATLLHAHEIASNAIGGTPAYMAPEQLDADPPASRATDIYGLGGLLYSSLCSRAPHLASAPSDSVEAMVRRPIDFAPLPKFPESLAAICRRALAENPSQRYANVAEFLHALRSIAQG